MQRWSRDSAAGRMVVLEAPCAVGLRSEEGLVSKVDPKASFVDPIAR